MPVGLIRRTLATLNDANGAADHFVLDADGDTSISAPTDDQIDIEVNGADDVRITANTLTALTGTTIAVADADKLTVGGVIVPQTQVLTVLLDSHGSLTTRNLFYAQTDGWTVTGIVYEPDIAEGTGSVVCTVCKVTGNNVAVAATAPMCTAFAVTGTAGTPVVATLTATGADLVLAATNKIGCIFSGGDSFLDSGRGKLYIKMKRS